MKTLPIDLKAFPFYQREKDAMGNTIKNKCGRDFLYYALAYYHPSKFGNTHGQVNPLEIERRGLFGTPVASWLAWTQIQFRKAPHFLKEHGLVLSINNLNIASFSDFVFSILLSRNTATRAIEEIEKNIDAGIACGIDISIGMGGLLDHVMFVYGYDTDNFYIFDTTKAPIEYELMPSEITGTTGYVGYMRLPKNIVRKRWTKFGRVWRVEKIF